MKDNKGLTLVELIISMAIFLVLMGIVTKAFENIVSFAGQASKSAESDISGIVGLEILRRDVEHAGFGLLWNYQSIFATQFKEVATADNFPIQGVKGETYNDLPPTATADLESAAPRPLLLTTTTTANRIIDGAGANLTNAGTDYLIVKSVPVGMNEANKRWGYMNYSGSGNSWLRKWGNKDDLQEHDRIIALITAFSTSSSDNRTLAMSAGNFQYKVRGVDDEVPSNTAFLPTDKSQHITTYAVLNNSSDTFNLRVPYNRADYYIKKPATASEMPQSCNPGTGILYKAIADQAQVAPPYTEIPLLDCVGDMQVMFELDTSGTLNNNVLSYTDSINTMTARQIREQLRTVRIYLLTHEGGMSRAYSFPYTDANRVLVVGDPALSHPALTVTTFGRVWTATMMNDFFGANWRNYRWKVLSIVVQPKNLYNQ